MTHLKLDPDSVGLAPQAPAETGEIQRAVDSEENLAYWRKQLAGIPAILELPTDRTRPPIQSFRAGREAIVFPPMLGEQLKNFCERENLSLAVVLLAAFQTLLMRHTRQEDIVVGMDLRTDQSNAAAAGSAVPIRTDFSSDPSFRQLMVRVDQATAEARAHKEISWEHLVEAVQPEQDPSRHPIIQASFLFRDSALASNLDRREAAGETQPLSVDLQLQITESSLFEAEFTYAADLFEAPTIRRMAGHLRRLLGAIVVNPAELVSRLPILTDAEREQVLVDWNDTWKEYPQNACLHELFEAQVARTPDAVAVLFESRRFTYRELNARANQLARHLVKMGVGPNILVGICVERSLEMVVGLLGILKAGGSYVPIDPAFPPDRIAFMLEDAQAPVLLTQESLLGHLPPHQAALVSLDSDWSKISIEVGENLPSRSKSEDLVYTMYTSGSTGKPKGVQIPHRALVNFLLSMAEMPGMRASDRLLAVTTLSFDIAGLEIYLPLVLGASVEIVGRDVYSDGNRLLSKLLSSGATVMQATPATWRMLLEAGWESSPGLKILIGGEAVPAKLADELMQRADSVWNLYGPTETTIWSTVRKFLPGEASASIGGPIANTEIFILDKLLQPVPIGVAGELLIGGDGLAKGYFNRPELTAEKFIAHPFSDAPAARLYRTGDLGRYLPNGEVEFLGRIDHQVKIRGFRIELGEIEAVLRQNPGINETTVVAREDVPGDKRVVAYFVSKSGASPSVTELRACLKEKLPVYMLPSSFVKLDRLPLTPNGKVDRRALPPPNAADASTTQDLVAARDQVESQLVNIWENVLGLRPISVTHDFFELGGHSLIAVRLMTRIEEAFGQRLPFTTLLQARTVEQLAEVIRQGGAVWSSLVPIQTQGSKPPFFCVHGAGGVVIRFHDLARHLGPVQPVYGLQARGLDGQHPCDSRVEDMAAHYLPEIRRIQPHGPYRLGGYSLGGMVALEMAQLLIAEGETAVSVVLFDTFCNRDRRVKHNSNSVGCKSNSWSERLSDLWTRAQETVGEEKWGLLARWRTTVKDGIYRRVSHMSLPRNLKNVRHALETAAETYVPRKFPGHLILFRSKHKPLLQFRDPHAGWAQYATQGLEICEVEGNHDSILLEPQVRVVAEKLKRYFENEVQSGAAVRV
jgi:amino acid adenylation domain-containing protein